MTGPQHYAEGDRLMALADPGLSLDDSRRELLVRAAQVHYVAALAAAAALRQEDGSLPGADYSEWYDAAGVSQSYGPRAPRP